MSSLLKGKTKQSRSNGGNGERQHLVAEWKEMELVCYLKELRLWDYANELEKWVFCCCYVLFGSFVKRFLMLQQKQGPAFCQKEKKNIKKETRF